MEGKEDGPSIEKITMVLYTLLERDLLLLFRKRLLQKETTLVLVPKGLVVNKLYPKTIANTSLRNNSNDCSSDSKTT
jgi:hypothetical protein